MEKELKLNVKALAVTAGLIVGLSVFLATWWIILWDYLWNRPSTDLTFLGRIYLGYDLTALGSLAGLAWGLVDGLIGGAIFAWLYNLFVARFAEQQQTQAAEPAAPAQTEPAPPTQTGASLE